MWNGLLQLPWWGYVLVALALTHVTIVAVTVYLHRHQAHRGLDLHPAIAHFFRFWLWLTTGMVTSEWVAIHRKHHAKCETDDDPHSPKVKGLRTVFWRGAELYREAARDPEIVARYGHGTPNDWLERKLYKRFSWLGITLMALANIVLFGPIGLTIWAVQMLWIPLWAAGVINGVGHYWGYRNFEPADASTNISPLGLLVGGEELHNNHHAFPSSAKFSLRPWEFDLGWFYIKNLERLRLAKVKRVAPAPRIQTAKAELDSDTVTAVVVNRLHVMANYGREVIMPTLREELQRADDSCRRLYKRARRSLIRDENLLDSHGKQRLNDVFSLNERLQTVYEYRRRLQQVWKRSSANQEALVKSLQEWCAQAEASGIRALQEFSERLRGYTLAGTAR
ncbi:fatty acid desaturase [Alkalilimnicola ehrlichii]|uniref:Acyl-CoA desaturase n=1 Tax=Alkalilimnicola ehrlichii TaxID=351052 RepID=A0A3E0WWN7_9GAMM|nr:fatty acid desaturase [Alkalilimnicola ehrlichii]RFA37414.1 acyl-CoA desaturase [Alkalilimnicola ehrlichii]